ncbi:hypothetical protein Tco_0743187 [Tanacetum coccineum]
MSACLSLSRGKSCGPAYYDLSNIRFTQHYVDVLKQCYSRDHKHKVLRISLVILFRDYHVRSDSAVAILLFTPSTILSIPSEDHLPKEAVPDSLLEHAHNVSRSAELIFPKADTSQPRKRLLLTTPRPSCEVGESSAAAAARQPGPTMAHRVDYSLVDTIETRVRDTERRKMTGLREEGSCSLRAEIEVLKEERLAYEQESIQTHQDLARSEAYCKALEARVTVLETECVATSGSVRLQIVLAAVQHIMRTHALEAGARG